MVLWLGSLTVGLRTRPLQELPTEDRSADQLSVPEITLLERQWLLQLREMFSVAVLEAQGTDVQSACSAWLPTKQATNPLGYRWIGSTTMPYEKTSKREGFTERLPSWAGSSE